VPEISQGRSRESYLAQTTREDEEDKVFQPPSKNLETKIGSELIFEPSQCRSNLL
jgi:hypothetical protein